jgi:hypothetical protein
VVPAKLLVFCFNPVKALNNVDLPQLGLPAKAICISELLIIFILLN